MGNHGAPPLITAIITTYNRADLLPRAVESVVTQTYPNLEILVVDDGSTHHTQAVLSRLKSEHPTIRVLHNDDPSGAPAARNRGIREARGTLVAGLDDDDEWHPERIDRLMDAYRPEFSCVTSDVLIDDGRRTFRWRKPRIIHLEDLLLTNLVGNQVLVERRRLLDVGGFDESLKAAQDYDLWVRLCLRYGPIRNVRKPLQTIHMSHAGRITSSPDQIEGYLQFYRKHRDIMSRSQRKYQLYSIRKKSGRKMSLRQTLAFVPPRRWWKEITGAILQAVQKA